MTDIEQINTNKYDTITLRNPSCEAATLWRDNNTIQVLLSDFDYGILGILPPEKARHLIELMGPNGSFSQSLRNEFCTSQSTTNIHAPVVYLNCFVIKPQQSTNLQLRGCVFAHTNNLERVHSAFQHAGICLHWIPNYNASVFFNTPQVQRSPWEIEEDGKTKSEIIIHGCKTNLKTHQIEGVRFLLHLENNMEVKCKALWQGQHNVWVRKIFEEAVGSSLLSGEVKFESKGGILADDMGLGKTLTTLSLIKITQNDALEYSKCGESYVPSSLVICPLSTLHNWKNEVDQHFEKNSLPIVVYYGDQRSKINLRDIKKTAIVLTTYHMVVPSIGCEEDDIGKDPFLSDINWFRVVLDEAQ